MIRAGLTWPRTLGTVLSVPYQRNVFKANAAFPSCAVKLEGLWKLCVAVWAPEKGTWTLSWRLRKWLHVPVLISTYGGRFVVGPGTPFRTSVDL